MASNFIKRKSTISITGKMTRKALKLKLFADDILLFNLFR